MNTIALTLYALASRPTAHGGDYTRIWQRDLIALGVDRHALKAFAAEHDRAVKVDPGRIGNNLSYYLSRDFGDWSAAFDHAEIGEVFDAMLDAGLDYGSPLAEAKALPERFSPPPAPRPKLDSYTVFGDRIARVHAVPGGLGL